MNPMHRLLKRASVLLAALAMALTAGVNVRASAAADLDLSKTGTIELMLMDTDGTRVSGGAVTIYEVASLYLDNGIMAYQYTSLFSGCTLTLDVTDTTLAASLVSFVSENGITGVEGTISSSGSVSFRDLELGLYLVVQTGGSAGYETFSPFVVTLPMEINGAWEYTIDASPKVSIVASQEPDTPQESASPEEETPVPETVTVLPQTGQLNWPIPVLAVGGMLLIVIGRILQSKRKSREKYAA